MLKNNKCVLTYNAPEEVIEDLVISGYKLINVSSEMVDMTISDIINGLRFETVKANLPKETVVLFNNFSDEEVMINIKSIRQFYKEGIFAVVTDASMEWKFSYLVEHLIEERKWHLKNQKGRA